MTVAQILGYVTSLMNSLGLTPFVYAAIVILLVMMVLRRLFGGGGD